MKKDSIFAYAKSKSKISCAVSAQLISAFVFSTRIVQSRLLLNMKFQASGLVYGKPDRNPKNIFFRVAAFKMSLINPGISSKDFRFITFLEMQSLVHKS